MNTINKFLQETRMVQIYCDMDGVLCDWEGRLKSITGKDYTEYTKKYGEGGLWKLINKIGTKFWSELEWLPDGKQLWGFLKPHNPIILSKPSHHPTSKVGKRIWIERELGKDTPYILTQDKSKYTDGEAILIDDRVENIYPWKRAGGIGILHHDTNETIAKLKNILR